MRDAPPPDETPNMSSETLLQEITLLRTRLRDLEDDGRSSICESMVEGEATAQMKKEIMKLADEKARQEQEFMNQLSSLALENQHVIADLKSKLARSQAKSDELEDRAIAVSEAHSTEVERLKENLTRADDEIAETRQEIDHVQHENEVLQMVKNELTGQMEAMRLEIENEKRRSESYRVQLKKTQDRLDQFHAGASSKEKEVEELREEIGEMNDTLTEMETNKNNLESELRTARAERDQAKAKIQKERNMSIDHSIFSAEKESLERECDQLEERIGKLQTKLAEKDVTIDALTNSLKDERTTVRKLRKELYGEQDGPPEGKDREKGFAHRPGNGSRDTKKELEFLRRRNKSLNEEVRQLKTKCQQSQNDNIDPAFPNQYDSPPRKTATETPMSPRTPVSGLVASYEKRINGRDEKREGAAFDWSHSAEKSNSLKEANRTIQLLEAELQDERETAMSLRKELSRNKGDGDSKSSLERKLKRSMEQVEKLQRKVDMLEKEKHQYRTDMKGLQNEVAVAKEIANLEEEKKEEERQEEVYRLRAQVNALESELENAMAQVENLNRKVSSLEQDLKNEKELKGELEQDIERVRANVSLKEDVEKGYNTEINRLKVELTKIQVAKNDLEKELTTRVKELETEIEAVENEADEEIGELKSQISSLQMTISGKTEQIALLEKEKAQICSSVAMASNAKNNEFEELQSELIEKTAQNTSLTREIQTLTMKIEELESVKRDKAVWLQDRVSELEAEIDAVRAVNKKSGSWEDIERLRRENVQLKETVRDGKLERRSLQDRIETLLSERAESKSVQILRERNAFLKEEVEKLTKRLKKLEESITRFAI